MSTTKPPKKVRSNTDKPLESDINSTFEDIYTHLPYLTQSDITSYNALTSDTARIAFLSKHLGLTK